MNYFYKICLGMATDETGENHTTYGIITIINGETILSIPDISADKEKLEKLISTMNKYNLSVIHLHDVIEDFL